MGTTLLVLCALVFVVKLLRGYPDNQWDFKVYYYAAQAWASGVNPYVPGNLPSTLGETGSFAFTYPPYVLALFWPFTLLPLSAALLVFLAIKLVLLAWLVVIWSRVLGVSVVEPHWVLFLAFAYSSVMFVDLASGNVVIIEQVLLWTGLAFLLTQKYGAFVTFVVAAAAFKFTPIVLLVMCFWIPDRRRYRYLAAGVTAFTALLVSTFAISPRLTLDFVRHVSSLDERGTTNPALLALVRDVFDLLAQKYGISIGATPVTLIYALLAMLVLALTWVSAVRIAATRTSNGVELILHLVVLAWAIVAPRFKVYAYMLVVAPTFFVATRSTRLPRALPLLLIACLTTNSWITSPENTALIAAYFSWFIAFGVWVLYLYELRGATPLQSARP